MKRVAILGAGISGLTCALYLEDLRKKHHSEFEVSLYDSATRAGGSIQTEQRDGFLMENGPDSFIYEKPWALDLCKKLQIDSKILNTQSENRKVFVVKGEALVSLPEGFYLIAPTRMGSFLASPLLSMAGKIRMGCEIFIPKRKSKSDESIGSFIRRRFGKEALLRVGQPMVAGVYSGDPELLSLSSTMTKFKDLENEHRSVILGLMKNARKHKISQKVSGPRYGFFLSFENGMETLTQTIASQLPAHSIHLGARVSIERADQGKWWVIESTGQRQIFDAICLSVNAHQAARLIQGVDSALAAKLDRSRFESVATLNLAYKRDQIKHPLDSFGFVVPAVENKSMTACTFSSQKYKNRAPVDSVLLRAFVGGAFGKEFFEMNDKDLKKAVCADLNKLLGIQGEPIFSAISRYPNSLPQYGLNHKEWVGEIEADSKKYPGLFLTGASYRGTGITNCVRDAQIEADKIYEKLYNFSNG